MEEFKPGTSVLESVNDPSIADPLSEVTRQERKSLLVASLIAVAIARGGLIPKEIDALGIALSPAEVTSLLYLIAVILVYFLAGFFLYATADLRQRRVKIAAGRARARPTIEQALQQQKLMEARKAQEEGEGKSNFDIDAFAPLAALADQTKLAGELLQVSTWRLVFEVHVPLFAGLTSLTLVLVETCGFPGWQIVLPILALALLIGAVLVAWRRRKKIVHWFGLRRHRYHNWRFKRLAEQAKRLKPDSPELKAIQEKAQKRLDKVLEGPWV